MNTHKNARLTFLRRLELVPSHSVAFQPQKLPRSKVSARSLPANGWGGTSPKVQTGCWTSLRGRLAAPVRSIQAYLWRLSDLRPPEPVQRYERGQPGDLLRIDIKKLGRIERPGHRVTGTREGRVQGAGWEFLYVAVDDHSRVAFNQMYPDERKESAVSFLEAAAAYYAFLGMPVQRLITDNGPAFHSKAFVKRCRELEINQKFTRTYRPQTNGKAERFIQSALREWACGHEYEHSDQRRAALPLWNHFYNWHRQHHGIGLKPPMSRLSATNNLLTLHT
jgi:transposase InsO family protein